MAKRFYESMFLVDSNWATTNWQECEDKVREMIEKYSGTIRRLEKKWDRRLAYPIKIERTVHRKGTYILSAVELPTDAPNQIKRDAELDPRFLRTLFVARRDDEIDKIFDDFPEFDVHRRRGEGAEEGGEASAESPDEDNE